MGPSVGLPEHRPTEQFSTALTDWTRVHHQRLVPHPTPTHRQLLPTTLHGLTLDERDSLFDRTDANALTRNALQERMQEEDDVAVQVAASTPTPTLTHCAHTRWAENALNELNRMDESNESNHTHTHTRMNHAHDAREHTQTAALDSHSHTHTLTRMPHGQKC